jgi:hypothetical protein|tara:strand:+ start:1947 stop:2228 length:282 start_codon:yes stop_codon:yes gene_type:complete
MDRLKFKQRLCNFILEVGNNIWEARKNGFFPYLIILLLFSQTTMEIQPKVITPLQNNFLIGHNGTHIVLLKGNQSQRLTESIRVLSEVTTQKI